MNKYIKYIVENYFYELNEKINNTYGFIIQNYFKELNFNKIIPISSITDLDYNTLINIAPYIIEDRVYTFFKTNVIENLSANNIKCSISELFNNKNNKTNNLLNLNV